MSKAPSAVRPRTRFSATMPAVTFAVVIATSLLIVCHLVVVLWLSLTDGSPGVGPLTYTLANFAGIFGDARTYLILFNTFGFALVALVVALGFGLPIAWLVERSDFPAKTLLFTLMAIGLLVPGFATAMGWLFLLHPRIGLLNQLLVNVLHLASAPINIMSIVGMGFVQGLNLAPLAFIMTAAVFRSMDPSLEEVAQMHGASQFAVLRRVTLPLAWPGILAASIYIIMTAFAAFDVPAIIGWGDRIFTFSTYLYLLLNPQDVLPRYGTTRIIPLELQESLLPFRIEEFSLREDSGGAGKFRGGLGFRKKYRMLEACSLDTNLDRTKFPPWGVQGGKEARPGRFTVVKATTAREEIIDKAAGYGLAAGDLVCVETGGGGGYGLSSERSLDLIRGDLIAGYVSPAAAIADYGIEIGPDGSLERRRESGQSAAEELS